LLRKDISDQDFFEIITFIKRRKVNRRLVGSIIPIISNKVQLKEIIKHGLLNNDRMKFNFLRKAIELGDKELFDVEVECFSPNSNERKKLNLILRHYNQSITTEAIDTEFSNIDEPYFESYIKKITKPWGIIKKENFYFDLRANEAQKSTLNSKIHAAIKENKPFLLLRIGDGECYGFTDSISLSERQEKHWWGVVLDSELRDEIKGKFLDIFENNKINLLAIPSAHKYVYYLNYPSLPFDPNENLENSVLSRNAHVNNSISSLMNKGLLGDSLFCDDQINKHFISKKRLLEFVGNAKRLFIISGKKREVILKSLSHLNTNIHVIEIPTHNLERSLDNSNKFTYSLPFVYLNIIKEIQSVNAGDLCLVSAGFIGKIFAAECAKKNAVSIDIGQAIEEIIS